MNELAANPAALGLLTYDGTTNVEPGGPAAMDENAVGVIMMIVLGIMSLAFFGLFIWTVVWSYGDAEKRGKSGCLVALLVAMVSWPLGLLIWYVARPEDPPGGRRT